jgi:cAMP phosphodiesterase
MPSQLKILGCSGGVGGSLRTTALLIDQDILIDAGTGVCDLSLEEMARIDWVFLTHSHLDHILSLPLLLDSVGARREKPVQVFALPETINTLRKHIFNNQIWPDFSKIPSIEQPFVVLNTLHVGETHTVGTRDIQVLPASHSVPAVGYALTAGKSTIAFTGDSGPCPDFWEAISTMSDLKHVLIETSFTDQDHVICY